MRCFGRLRETRYPDLLTREYVVWVSNRIEVCLINLLPERYLSIVPVRVKAESIADLDRFGRDQVGRRLEADGAGLDC